MLDFDYYKFLMFVVESKMDNSDVYFVKWI